MSEKTPTATGLSLKASMSTYPARLSSPKASRRLSIKVDHSTPSAVLVEEACGKGIGRILSYCIAGHHAGLPDWIGEQSALAFRLQNGKAEGIPAEYRNTLAECCPSSPPWKFDSQGLDMSLWIRMLFSCLVDADFLDTE